ncbi:LON peptidase substrate-binding domain-containing protein [Haloechinothrix halophila]|uniref:LON peptidase substrate-binding domain-containing protein n=1 Tax=Haloechinothrix halophila TaxID=1069073 RepID=UPI0005553314|nr:LON peptidase substrate-binding domain-containing protein [Haloechinothrix halophila]
MRVPADSPSDRSREQLPLFPLHTVLLPGVHLPLHVFEPRYRQLVDDVVHGVVPDREFGVIAIRNALVSDVDRVGQLHPVGCTARLREVSATSSGGFDIVTTGSRRFLLHELTPSDTPYLMGEVEWLRDEPTLDHDGTTAQTLAEAARTAHERYCDAAWHDDDWSAPSTSTDVADLAYLLAADCLLPLAEQQALLRQTDPLHRLRLVTALLSREAGFVSALRAVPVPHEQLDDISAAAKLN